MLPEDGEKTQILTKYFADDPLVYSCIYLKHLSVRLTNPCLSVASLQIFSLSLIKDDKNLPFKLLVRTT